MGNLLAQQLRHPRGLGKHPLGLAAGGRLVTEDI
jgi:hypothetical protein